MTPTPAARRVSAPGRNWKIALAGTLLAAAILAAPLASASGSGYDLSFSASAGSASPNVALTSLTTSASGSSVTVTAQVSGQFVTNSDLYYYYFYFGGAAASNSSAYLDLSNNSTDLTLISTIGGYNLAYVPYSLGSGGSVLTFEVTQANVGPASSFTANAEALYTSSTGTVSISWLGSNFLGGGGSGTCTATSCTGTSTTTNSGPSALEYGAVALVVIIIVVVAVVVLVTRRKKSPPAMAPSGSPMPPPPPAGMTPQGPAGQMPPPPPPP